MREHRVCSASDILGTGFDFGIEIKQGAGAFVCGEETALIASIEGRRGMPRPRPPFPAVKRAVRPAVEHQQRRDAGQRRRASSARAPPGSRASARSTSKGTKTFALTGQGQPTRAHRGADGDDRCGEVVNEIGGGIAGGGRFKAAQTGGPSGGCLPTRLLDLPIDYERLKEAGSIMGSGGLVIMDESTCMVDLARYFLAFTRSESCGQCTPCREGTGRMLEILERICAGRGPRRGTSTTLEQLAGRRQETSLCGLGQTAPNPVLTTLRYFREEYEEHVRAAALPGRHLRGSASWRPCSAHLPRGGRGPPLRPAR